MKKSKLIFLAIIIFTVLACFESANEGGWGEHAVGDGSEWQKFFIISENTYNNVNY